MFSSVGGVRSPLSTGPLDSLCHDRSSWEGRKLREQPDGAGDGRRDSRGGGCEEAAVENMWEAVELM